MRSSTIGKFFEWLTLHERVDPVHALRLEDEWRRLTFGMAGEIATTVPSEEWPRLWDAYDERVWFDYPLHVVDRWNFLAEATGGETTARGIGVGKKQRSAEDWERDIDEAYEACGGGNVPIKEIAGYLQRDGKPSEKTIRNFISKSNSFSQFTINGEKYITAKK